MAGRARGQGVGLALLSAGVAASERAGIWTLQEGVFPENSGSLALCPQGRIPRGGNAGAARLHVAGTLARRGAGGAAQFDSGC